MRSGLASVPRGQSIVPTDHHGQPLVFHVMARDAVACCGSSGSTRVAAPCVAGGAACSSPGCHRAFTHRAEDRGHSGGACAEARVHYCASFTPTRAGATASFRLARWSTFTERPVSTSSVSADHVLRGDDPWPLRHGRPCLDATNVGAYFAEIERERARALSAYGSWSCRALSSRATTRTRTVLDMPWPSGCAASSRWTRGRPRRWSRLAPPAPRFCPAHPHDWGPTPGEQDEKALVDYLRSPRSVFLTRLEQPPVALVA